MIGHCADYCFCVVLLRIIRLQLVLKCVPDQAAADTVNLIRFYEIDGDLLFLVPKYNVTMRVIALGVYGCRPLQILEFNLIFFREDLHLLADKLLPCAVVPQIKPDPFCNFRGVGYD